MIRVHSNFIITFHYISTVLNNLTVLRYEIPSLKPKEMNGVVTSMSFDGASFGWREEVKPRGKVKAI